jgi:hypothetical protein
MPSRVSNSHEFSHNPLHRTTRTALFPINYTYGSGLSGTLPLPLGDIRRSLLTLMLPKTGIQPPSSTPRRGRGWEIVICLQGWWEVRAIEDSGP